MGIVAPADGNRMGIIGRRSDEYGNLDAISVELARGRTIAWDSFWDVSN